MFQILGLRDVALYRTEYEQLQLLGKGKFGVVYQVEDKNNKTIYAAKHVKARKKEDKLKALEEVKLLQKFHNPHIVKFVDAFEGRAEIIVIMEYLDGGELFERIVDDEFILKENDCCQFIRQICQGIQYLHNSNIVHLDLKVSSVSHSMYLSERIQ